MKNIRVLVFAINFTGKELPGIESVIFDEYLKLSKNVSLIVLAKNIGNRTYENIRAVKVPITHKPMWTFKNIINYTNSMIKVRKDFDVIFTRMIGAHILIPAIIAKLFFRKKFIIFISGSMQVLKIRKNWYNRPINKIAISVADKVSTHSKYSLEDYEHQLGNKIDRKKVFFLNHYVDTNKFKRKNQDDDSNLVISVGRITPQKGFETLIKAVPYITKEIPDVQIKIVGPIKDQEYYNKLWNLSKKMGCEKNIEIVGPVSHEKLADLLSSSKIYVQTQKGVGVSTSIAEAMACGNAVISTSKGGIPNPENNEKNGFILDDNPVIISRKIIELLQDDTLRKKVGESARKTIEKNFSEEFFIGGLSHNIINVMSNK